MPENAGSQRPSEDERRSLHGSSPGVCNTTSVIVLDVLALIHLARHRRTTSDWAWALVILALPLLGVLLYALLGPRRRRSDNTVRDTITSPR